MGAIFLHQLHDNLRSLRFQVSLGVLLLFFVANGVIYTMKTSSLTVEAARINTLNEERFDRVNTVQDAATNTYKIRSTEVGTEFIAESGSDWFLYAMYVNPSSGSVPGFGSSRTTNHWMRRFEVVDWTVIVRYVLSFLCIVLSYNAISGELERGTLRLVLANSLPRGSFLLGKFAAHLITLLVATALGSLISLLILVLGKVIELDLHIWQSYALFLLGTTFFIALFLLLGMGVSILARNSASSLILLITAWTVLIVVIPQSSYLVAVTTVDHVGAFWEKLDTYEEEARTSLQQDGIEPRPPALAQSDNYALEKRYIARINEMEKGKFRLFKEIIDQQIDQFKMAKSVNMLSPGFAFQYAVEALLGNGIMRYEHFARQGWDYKETLRQFFRARDAADANSPHVLFLQGFMSAEKVDSNNIPRFAEKPLPLSDSIAGGMVPIIVLVLETALAFFFALWAFNRADIAG